MSAKVSLTKKEATTPPPATAETGSPAAPAIRSPGASQTPTQKIDGLTLIIARNSFYLVNNKKMMQVFLGQFVLIFVMIAVIVKLLDFTDSRDHFFPAQADNTPIIERPLSEPVFSNEQIRSWVENAITRTMTFGFYDHLLRMQTSRSFFTTSGWASFTKALETARIFETIGATEGGNRTNKQVVSARLRSGDRATIVQSGIMRGRYSWKVNLNIDVTFSNRSTQTRHTWHVELLVTRLPTMESREGIGISQIIATAQAQGR